MEEVKRNHLPIPIDPLSIDWANLKLQLFGGKSISVKSVPSLFLVTLCELYGINSYLKSIYTA